MTGTGVDFNAPVAVDHQDFGSVRRADNIRMAEVSGRMLV